LCDKKENSLELHTLSNREQEKVDSASLIWKGFKMWEVVSRYARKLNANHCVFMEVNHLQIAIALKGIWGCDFDVSGILFFPFVRIDKSSGWLRKVKFCRTLEYARKYLQVGGMVGNRCVKKVFLFNDEHAAESLNKMYDSSQFVSIPDPVFSPVEISSVEGSTDRTVLAETRKQTRFLFFGEIRREKGIFELIKSLYHVSADRLEELSVHVLGSSVTSIEEEVDRQIEKLEEERPNLDVQYEDRFLEYEELERALRDCDAVLAPYQQTEGSSGVIGHAARHRKPVIGPSSGLIGDLIREYNLGITKDATDPRAIAEAIGEICDGGLELGGKEGMKRYVDERSPDAFASAILDAISE
jgi:glycosyltransferase involved in cell wall biosynthesis